MHRVAAPDADRRPPFFLHIEKTGGNTVNAFFSAYLPAETIFPEPPQLTLEAPDHPLLRARLDRLRYVHGHVDADLTQVLPLDRFRLLTFLRDPTELLISHYLYQRAQPELPFHAAALALPIDAFFRFAPGYLPDRQARTVALALGLCAPEDEALSPAQLAATAAALAERFDFVGLTERMDECLDRLAERYALPRPPTGRHNPGPDDRALKAACRAVLRRDEFQARLQGDLALVAAAGQRLDALRHAHHAAAQRARFRAARAGGESPALVAGAGGAGLALVDGWQPQRWFIHATGRRRGVWWTDGATGRLLLHLPARTACRIGLAVLATAGFGPGEIVLRAGGVSVPLNVEGSLPEARLSGVVPAPACAEGFVELELIGPRAVVPPEAPDEPRRGFAVTDLWLDPLPGPAAPCAPSLLESGMTDAAPDPALDQRVATLQADLAALAREVRALRDGQTIYLGDHEALTRLYTGHRIYVDTRDVGICSHLMLEGRWEPWVEAALRDATQPGMRFADVGANFGYYTLLAAHWVGPGGQVAAFEANPGIAAKLRRSIAVNGFESHARLHELAAWSGEAELDFTFDPTFSGGGAVGGSQAQRARVRAAPLDRVLADWPSLDVLKLDVEGAEQAVLQGATALLGRSPALVMVVEFVEAAIGEPGPLAYLHGLCAQGFRLALVEPAGVTAPLTPEACLARLDGQLGYLHLSRR